MREITQIEKELADCTRELEKLLAKRMECVQERTACKRAGGLPILPSEKEEFLPEADITGGKSYDEELKNIFACIRNMEKRAEAKVLFQQNIALIGFMGVGKSTMSHYLRDRFAMEEVETDAMIVESEGMAITDIFAKYGEPYFRDCESKAILRLQDCHQAVISCGGGAVMREENVVNLKKSSRIVLLTATPETILERVKDSDERPILNGHMNVEYIAGLMEKRREKYEAAADLAIATDGKSVEEICEEMIQKLGSLK